jgi:hypothetical protein
MLVELLAQPAVKRIELPLCNLARVSMARLLDATTFGLRRPHTERIHVVSEMAGSGA